MSQCETSGVLDLGTPRTRRPTLPSVFQSEKAASDDPFQSEYLQSEPNDKKNQHKRRGHHCESRRIHDLCKPRRRIGENALLIVRLAHGRTLAADEPTQEKTSDHAEILNFVFRHPPGCAISV